MGSLIETRKGERRRSRRKVRSSKKRERERKGERKKGLPCPSVRILVPGKKEGTIRPSTSETHIVQFREGENKRSRSLRKRKLLERKGGFTQKTQSGFPGGDVGPTPTGRKEKE